MEIFSQPLPRPFLTLQPLEPDLISPGDLEATETNVQDFAETVGHSMGSREAAPAADEFSEESNTPRRV